MAGPTEQITQEIEALKALTTKCKIMKNIGEFSYIIDATVPNTTAIVKFQLTGRSSLLSCPDQCQNFAKTGLTQHSWMYLLAPACPTEKLTLWVGLLC